MLTRSTLRNAALGLTLCLGVTTVAFASPTDPDAASEARVDKLQEHLGLDEATATKVHALMAAAKKTTRALRDEARELKSTLRSLVEAEDWAGAEAELNALEDIRDEIQAHRDAARARVEPLLNAEQRVKLRIAMHKMARRHRGQSERGHHGGQKGSSSSRF